MAAGRAVATSRGRERDASVALSHARDALGPERKPTVHEAFALAAVAQKPAAPLDWLETTCPRRWRLGGREVAFEWTGEGGVELG